MPFRIQDGRAYGPGVYDMKAGIAMMIFALRALKEAGAAHRPVTILLDTDEEVGSVTGRPVVEATARECEAVLVLEPSQGPQGHLKTSRKGVGSITIRVLGRASHSGVDFEKGRSAITELARQIIGDREIYRSQPGNHGEPGRDPRRDTQQRDCRRGLGGN